MKRTVKITLCLMSIFFLFSIGTANASWILENRGDAGGDGYVVEPSIIVQDANFDLYGSNNYNSNLDGTYTLYHTILTEPVTNTISWFYQTVDGWGPEWDPAGYYVNGVYNQLTDSSDDASSTQSGTFNISLNAGDDAGFYVYTYVNRYGRGRLTIAGIPDGNPQIPEPTTMLLLGLGLMGLAGIRRKFKG